MFDTGTSSLSFGSSSGAFSVFSSSMTFTYVFVLLLSFGVLKEKVSKGKLIGNLIIILGVLVYTLP